MGEVTVYTAARTKQIEDNTVVNVAVVEGDLIFYKGDGSEINLGPVTSGAPGEPGPPGADGIDGMQRVIYVDGVGYGSRPATEDPVLWINKVNDDLPVGGGSTAGGAGYVADLDFALVAAPV